MHLYKVRGFFCPECDSMVVWCFIIEAYPLFALCHDCAYSRDFAYYDNMFN